MRVRVLAAVAVFAAALLAPSAAFAVPPDPPVLAQPTSPTATAPISLNWGDVAGEDGYHVYRADSGCLNEVDITALIGPPAPADHTTFADISPVQGMSCYFVRSYNGDGESGDSNHVLVTYDVVAPSTPGTPTGASPVASAPVLSFAPSTDPDSGISHYDVYRNGLQVNAAGIPAAGPYTWTDDALQSLSPVSVSGNYSYTVRAVDGAGNQSAVSGARVILFDVDLPSTPGTPTGASPVASAPVLSFTPSTDADSGISHYDVYRNGVQVNAAAIPAGGPYTWSDVAGQSSTPVSVSGNYSYTVRAVDGAGNQSAVSGARVILFDVDLPSTPGTPTGASPVASAPVLSFTPSTDADSGISHYDVYRNGVQVNAAAIPAGGPYTWSDVAGQSSTPVSVSGSYSYRIRAVDVAGNFSQSGARVILFDVDLPSTPGTPTGASPVASAPVLSFTPSTDADSGISHYDVYRNGVQVNAAGIPAGGPYTWSDVAGQSSTPVSVSGSYSYRIRAVDAAGNFSQSGARVILFDVNAPSTPGTPTGASPVASAPALSFTPSTDADSGISHYDVYRNGVQVNAAGIPAGGPYTWSDVAGQSSTPVSVSGSYSYTVRAVDAAGNQSALSGARVILFDVDAPTVILGGVLDNAKVSGTVALSASAADTGGSGMLSVQFGQRPAGSSAAYTDIGAAVTIEPYVRDFVTTSGGLLDGLYQIRALATDVAGNTQPASVTNVLVDNHAPTAPTAPTGLSPVSAAPTITFNGSTDPASNGVQSGVDHYDVYRGPTKVNLAPILHTGAGPYTWSDAAGQSNSPASGTQTYSYTVKAVDGAGNVSVASGAHVIVLDPAAASAPTAVTALATPTNQRPQVSWVAPLAPPFTVDHYDVFRNSGGSPVGVVVAPSTTFTDNSASLPDGSYTYQVVAAASDGTTGVASGAVTVLYDTIAPAAPGGVSASAALDGSVAINWAAAGDGSGSGIARYVVRRSQSSLPPASVSDGDATCQGTATSCTDATALNGKLYRYAVFAIDRAGNTSLAGVAPAVTASDQLAPAKPQGLTATAGDASVALKWAGAGPDDDVAGYVLVAKQGTQPPGNETDGARVCPAIVGTSTNCVATGLTNGATYTFGLFALDEALNRSLPAVVTAVPNGKVTDVKAPAAVSKLRATVSGRKVTLTWKNPADHDFDHVEITAGERKPAALKASKRVYSGKGTKATTTLAPGQSRWFVVVAYDTVGNASEPALVHVTIAAPSKFGPAPRARVHGRVKLSWPLAKHAKYYNVQVYAGKKRILVSWPAGRALKLPRAKLKRGTTYTWYVWPGLGAKAKAHYGKLIGRNVFTFTG